MRLPRALPFVLGAGAVVAILAFFRRGLAGRRERVDLYFDDGSMVSLGENTPEAARLLQIARSVL